MQKSLKLWYITNENVFIAHLLSCKCDDINNLYSVSDLVTEYNVSLTSLYSEYHYFTSCTENKAVTIGCFWPHPVVEHYIILIHKQFFSNCTYTSMIWHDTAEDTFTLTLYILIIVPVFLTLAMVTSVVWCSKQR